MLSVRFRPLLGKLGAPPEMLAPGFDAPPPASSPAPANAADHSHPRRRWLEQTGPNRRTEHAFSEIPAPVTGPVAANLLIFLTGILPAQAWPTKLVG
jgi:hypothetical protein